jgi:hypothetical protein
MLTPASLTLLVGLALIVVGLIGGGIEVKEVKIPQVPMIPRTASFLVGCILLTLVIFFPQIFAPPNVSEQQSTPNVSEQKFKPPDLGQAITHHLIQVSEVKRILQHIGLYNGAIDSEYDAPYFQAVAKFQQTQNITQDGLVGADTYIKLQEAWPEFFGQTKPSPPPPSSIEEKRSPPIRESKENVPGTRLIPRTDQQPGRGVNCSTNATRQEPIERLICADAELAKWDGELFKAFERKVKVEGREKSASIDTRPDQLDRTQRRAVQDTEGGHFERP